MLQLAELEKLLPVPVDFLLGLLNHPLVAGLEHVGEAALGLQVFLHRQLVLGLVAQDVLALDHLVQRPHAGLHRQLRDLHQLLAGIAPASRAGGHDVQKRRAGGVDGLVGLLRDVLEVPNERGLGNIRNPVGHHDLRQVLLLLGLAGDHLAHRSRGGVSEVGRGAGALDTRVHVGLVVVADIDHIVSPLHRSAEALEADVVGSAVSAEGDEFVRRVDLAPLFHGVVSRLDAGQGCRRVLEGVVDEAVLIGRIGVHEGGDLQAAGGGADHRVVLRLQRPQHGPHGDGAAAARAHSVTAGKAVFLHDIFFQIIGHVDCLPPYSRTSR